MRVANRLARIVGKNVRQQRSRDVLCLLRRVAARVFQFVREHTNKAVIGGRFAEEVILFLFSREEDRLQWSATSIRLDPAVASFVHGARPDPCLMAPESRVRHFDHDAADIFVQEEIVSGKLHVIEIAVYVEKEGIAAPTEEKTVVAGFRYQSFALD